MARSSARTNRWTIVLLMMTASAGVHHPTVIAPFLNEIGSEFSAPDALVGQIGTVTFAASFLVALTVAPFIGRLELGKLLAAAVALLAVMGIITALAPAFWMLFPVRAIAGVGGGIAAAGSMAAVGRAWTDPDERKFRQGFVVGALAGGPALLTPLLRLIGERWTWEIAVASHSVMYLLIAALVFASMPKLAGTSVSSRGIAEELRSAAKVIAIPAVGFPLLLRLSSQGLLSVITIFLAGFLDDEYRSGAGWIGPSFGFLAAGFMAASFLAGRTMKSMGGPGNTMVVATAGLVAAAIALAWITPHPAATTAFALAFGIAVGIFFNGVVALVFDGAGERFATAMFVDGALIPTGGLVGSAAGGVAIAWGGYEGWKLLITVFAIALFVPLVAAIRASRKSAGA